MGVFVCFVAVAVGLDLSPMIDPEVRVYVVDHLRATQPCFKNAASPDHREVQGRSLSLASWMVCFGAAPLQTGDK